MAARPRLVAWRATGVVDGAPQLGVRARARVVQFECPGQQSADHAARGLARRGDVTRARQLLAALESGKHGYAPAYELAKVYLGFDQPERAIDLLEQAVRERAHSIAFIKVDPQLDALRMRPRFMKLVASMD